MTLKNTSLDEDEFTLDTWSPKKTLPCIPKSQWRQEYNEKMPHSSPGLDDLRKIKLYIKKKYPDCQIMDAFNINCDTLVAIKNNCYCPVEGISLDNLSKISKEFSRVEKKLDRIFEALKFLSNNGFEAHETQKRLFFKSLISSPRNAKSPLQDRDE